MKRILAAGAVLLIAMTSTVGYCQSIAPEILQQYPAGVVVRLYEITAYMKLSKDKQMALAACFQREDSLAVTLIAQGKPPAGIRRLQTDEENAAIKKILSAVEYDSYCNTKYIDHARKEGLLMARLASRKYNCDDNTAVRLRDLYFSRNLASEKLYASGVLDANAPDDNVYGPVYHYDSLIDRYTNVAASGAYIRKKIDLLEKIQPLQQRQKTALQDNFYKLCLQSPEKSYADDLNEALHLVILDTIYYARIYQEEISRQSISNAKDLIKDLEKKNNLTKDGVKTIFPLVAERERRLAVLHTAFPSYNTTRDSMTRSVNNLYDSLIRVAMIRDGSAPMASQFTIAVKERKNLGLSESQVDSLLAKAAELERMKDAAREKDPLGKFDSKPFETENMLKIVSEDQYRTVLIVKNKSQAKSDAEQDWQEMQQRNLAANLNKDSTMRQLTDYYLAKWVMYYRYGNDKIKQAANVKDIYEHMPPALRALTSARKYNNPTTAIPQHL